MKRKLASVLLALTLCVGLAVPAFADPAEEVSVPEETEVLTAEVYECEEVGDNIVFSWGIADLTWTAVETEDGTKTVAYVAGPMLENNFSATVQATIGNCSVCGKYNWAVVPQGSSDWKNDGNASTHNAYFITGYMCQTPGCISVEYRGEWRRESHSWGAKSFTGNDYHLDGSPKHMAEYAYSCSACGYRKTQWESYLCPGGNGGSCLYPGRVPDEPVVTEAIDTPEESDPMEDMTDPEDVFEPEEVAEPEDVTAPEETTEPEEVIEPEVADIPEEPEAPAETVEPEEPIEPEEPTIPEDPIGPGETAAPEEGESGE